MCVCCRNTQEKNLKRLPFEPCEYRCRRRWKAHSQAYAFPSNGPGRSRNRNIRLWIQEQNLKAQTSNVKASSLAAKNSRSFTNSNNHDDQPSNMPIGWIGLRFWTVCFSSDLRILQFICNSSLLLEIRQTNHFTSTDPSHSPPIFLIFNFSMAMIAWMAFLPCGQRDPLWWSVSGGDELEQWTNRSAQPWLARKPFFCRSKRSNTSDLRCYYSLQTQFLEHNTSLHTLHLSDHHKQATSHHDSHL